MLIIETYQTDQRKDKQRYRSARSAPTSDISVCADDTNTSSCSAPTTTGGMGVDSVESATQEAELSTLICPVLENQNLGIDKNDEPTIEPLFCRSHDEFDIEHLLNDMHQFIDVPAYQITKFLPEGLKSDLPSVKDIEAGLV